MGFSRQEYWSGLPFPSSVSDKVVKAKNLFPLMIMKPFLFQEFTSFSLNFFPVFLLLLISIFRKLYSPEGPRFCFHFRRMTWMAQPGLPGTKLLSKECLLLLPSSLFLYFGLM